MPVNRFAKVFFPWLGLSCLGCGGGAVEPVESPATVVQVQSDRPATDAVVEEGPELSESNEPEPSTLIERLAMEHCKGMEHPRQPVATFLAPDTANDQAITLEPGKCYTIIAVAPEGHEVDLTLQLSPNAMPAPMPAMVLAQGEKHENWSVLGSNGNCFKQVMPLALPATIGLRCSSPSGILLLLTCEK